MHLVKAYYRVIEDNGATELTKIEHGQKIVIPARNLRCWKGLSQYTVNEACMLIDGAIEECKQLDIPTDTPDELKRMKKIWGVNIG